MDYAISYFGKGLNEISYQDVVNFFRNEQTETDQIEFKSISQTQNLDTQFNAIYKAICAFLNSSGGLIIWGSPKGEKAN